MAASDNLGLISTSIKPLLDKITALVRNQVLNGIPLLATVRTFFGRKIDLKNLSIH